MRGFLRLLYYGLINKISFLLIYTFAPVAVQAGIFGYQENERENLEMFPQWLSVLERNVEQQAPAGNCNTRVLDQCHLKKWKAFLKTLTSKDLMYQLESVNNFANKQQYILDIENYGVEDFWATPNEFLSNNGDCEDYAIIKMLSLKYLGVNVDKMRLVVLQDTNLGIAHAVLAVKVLGDTYVMDNQVNQVVSHKYILHYVPIYALSEYRWWMFLPEKIKNVEK